MTTQIQPSPKRKTHTRFTQAMSMHDEVKAKLIEAQINGQRLAEENKKILAENAALKEKLSIAAFGRDTAGLLNLGEVLTRQVAMQRLCGIYFLLCAGEIIYIGQSVNVWSRIESHRCTVDKKFDAVAFDLCDEVDLNRLEIMYIEKFSPRLNRVKGGYSRRYEPPPPPWPCPLV